ncbi:MAG: helix-turn-helix domain-containing protein [Boseongicola sp.]
MSGRPKTSKQLEASNLKGFDDFELLLGDIMRGERATLGKSLLDVQRELKIKANYIAAIENSDPAAFDTPGFIAGYVRSYARYLGLDPEWAFKTFCDEGNFTVAHGMSADASVRRNAKPSRNTKRQDGAKKPAHLRDPFTEPSVSYLPKAEAVFAGFEPRAIGSIIVLLALIAGIGYGGWAVLQEVQKVRFTPVEQTPEVLAELDPLAGATAPVENSSDSGVAPPISVDSFDRLYRPEALDVPVMAARDGPIAAIDPNSTGALAPDGDERFLAGAEPPHPDNLPFAVPGSTDEIAMIAAFDSQSLLPPVQVVEVGSPSVTLFAVRPSWVRVTGADGTVIFEKILNAGEQFDVPLTEAAATLRAGNAGSLYFTVNGATYGPAGDGPAVVKNVVLAPDALQQNYSVADLSQDSDLARFVAVAEAAASE